MDFDLDTLWLARGAHPGSDGGCLMEWVAALAGLEKTDRPACTNVVVATMAIGTNDGLDDTERQSLRPLIPRLARAARTVADDRVDVRLALWCARSVADAVPGALRRLHDGALAAAEGRLAGRLDDESTRVAARTAAEAGARDGCPALYAAADAAHAAALLGVDGADVERNSAVANAAGCAVRRMLSTPGDRGPVASAFLGDLLSAHAAAVAAEGADPSSRESACCRV